MSKVKTKGKQVKSRGGQAPRHSKKRHRSHAGLIVTLVLLVLLVGGYFAGGLYFSKHFLPGTTINNSNVSFMTVEQAKEKLLESSKSYKLTLIELDYKKEVIDGADVGLKAVVDPSFDSILNVNKGFRWGVDIFGHKNETFSDLISYEYDEEMLDEIVDELECIDPQYRTEAKDAEIVFKDGTCTITPESLGNVAHRDELIELVKDAIAGQKESVNLVEKNLYDKPTVYSDDPDLNAKKTAYDSIGSIVITMKFGPKNVRLDSKTISGWANLKARDDGTYGIEIDQKKIEEYVKTLASTYDTFNKPKYLKAHNGNTVEITTSYYGWELDQVYTVKMLKRLVEDGRSATINMTSDADGDDLSDIDKEVDPDTEDNIKDRSVRWLRWWNHAAVGYNDDGSEDYGTTYIEVSIGEQHMWMYQNGAVVLETDVVTGNPNLGNGTPPGAYRIIYHQAPATLSGPGYTTQVAYWMVFTTDIGFHDATWQPWFGGQLYLTNGSHGCVNMPLDQAAKLYDLVYDGMPVFVY